MTVYDVYTDLDPAQLTEVAKETYRLWLSWALGNDAGLGIGSLINPTGRYAASLSWRKTGAASVAIMSDEHKAPEAEWIETGTDGADMLQMLDHFSKTAKDGTRYRVIPLRPHDASGPLKFNMNSIVRGPGGGEKLPAGQGRIWSVARPRIHADSEFVTMTDRNPNAWQVPPFTPYAPAHALKDLLERQYGGRKM